MRVRYAGMCGLLLLGARFAPARAQPAVSTAAGRYSLAGVVASTEGTPLGDAEVFVVDAQAPRSVRTNEKGQFRLGELPAASVTIRVRHVGYKPRTMDVRLAGPTEHQTPLHIVLEPMVAELEMIRVFGEEGAMDARLREFYERSRTNNFGHYIDQRTIEQRHPQYLSEVMRRIPGVSIVPSRRIGNLVKVRGCTPLLWVDGVRLPGGELDEVVQPSDIAAIEIYNSFAGIPAQYFDRTATCGTVLLWTRSR